MVRLMIRIDGLLEYLPVLEDLNMMVEKVQCMLVCFIWSILTAHYTAGRH